MRGDDRESCGELVAIRRIDIKQERTTRMSPDQLAANTTEIRIIELDGQQ